MCFWIIANFKRWVNIYFSPDVTNVGLDVSPAKNPKNDVILLFVLSIHSDIVKGERV